MSYSPTTIKQFLASQTASLNEAGVGTARLDVLVLLEDVLNTNRTQIIAHPERQLTEVEYDSLTRMVDKRRQHIPLSYIRGKAEFYGHEFAINESVLEPRPETETMIELLVRSLPVPGTIIDIGTGSGALAITAKKELLTPTVYAVDISQKCLQVAANNAAKLAADITLVCGDLLTPLADRDMDRDIVLLCNLPYVPDSFKVNRAALHEPKLALYGGTDGLNVYRKLFTSTALEQIQPSHILTEALPPQHEELAAIAAAARYELSQSDDFIQVFARSTP